MSLDRFVKFDDEKPTGAEVERAVRRFLGGVGMVEWDPDGSRIYVYVPGVGTDPFSEHHGNLERWIEVYVGSEHDQIDVITRQQDPFTNALARGIAESLAQGWNGEIDVG